MFAAVLAHAQYVRKLKEPDFFIPEGEKMHQAEKLPEIKIVVKKPEEQPENKGAENILSKDNESVITAETPSSLKNIPEYKNKYNQYIDDIMRFYSDGTMPKNERLQRDLAAMNSDEKKPVIAPAPTQLTSEEMAKFYAVYQKMLKD